MVPPVKKINWTSSPFLAKMPVSLATHAGSWSALTAL